MSRIIRQLSKYHICFIALCCILFLGLVTRYLSDPVSTLSHRNEIQPLNTLQQQQPKYPVNETLKYYHQSEKIIPDFIHNSPKQSREDVYRSGEIKKAFLHAWSGYRTYAWGHDNISPLSKEHSDNWQSWGINIVDSLDTLLLMGLEEEYNEALKFVKTVDFTKALKPVNFFETVIRYLGGLLGAYDLRPDPILLKQAQTLADQLLPTFKTNSGVNAHKLKFKDGTLYGIDGEWDKTIYLAELGSFQLEFYRLSQLTNNLTYAKIAQRVVDLMDNVKTSIPGLYPLDWDYDTLKPSSKRVAFGAMGDSFYEYLLKRYLLTNQTEPQYLRMYTQSIDSMYSHLIQQRGPEFDNIMILGELDYSGNFRPHMDHLGCFVPGMLSLSGIFFNRTVDFKLSQELVHTCYTLYNNTATGLGPEAIEWIINKNDKFITSYQPQTTLEEEDEFDRDQNHGIAIANSLYMLRPETLESIFYAYRTTGDPIYQDWAWSIYQSIQSYCRVEAGYADYLDVATLPDNTYRPRRDSMESFFLAETLKYLYLIFSPPSTLDLHQYVLTTEAHPLKVSPSPLTGI